VSKRRFIPYEAGTTAFLEQLCPLKGAYWCPKCDRWHDLGNWRRCNGWYTKAELYKAQSYEALMDYLFKNEKLWVEIECSGGCLRTELHCTSENFDKPGSEYPCGLYYVNGHLTYRYHVKFDPSKVSLNRLSEMCCYADQIRYRRHIQFNCQREVNFITYNRREHVGRSLYPSEYEHLPPVSPETSGISSEGTD
jgi:hypothetical protein